MSLEGVMKVSVLGDENRFINGLGDMIIEPKNTESIGLDISLNIIDFGNHKIKFQMYEIKKNAILKNQYLIGSEAGIIFSSPQDSSISDVFDSCKNFYAVLPVETPLIILSNDYQIEKQAFIRRVIDSNKYNNISYLSFRNHGKDSIKEVLKIIAESVTEHSFLEKNISQKNTGSLPDELEALLNIDNSYCMLHKGKIESGSICRQCADDMIMLGYKIPENRISR